MKRSARAAFLPVIALVACKTVAEPESNKATETQGAPAPKASAAGYEPTTEAKATLKEMLDKSPLLAGEGKLVARIMTSLGTIDCALYEDKAPLTVANFIGLANGMKAWKRKGADAARQEPAYDGTSFHRVIPGFMIQGGDPNGDGSGEPGYVFQDEMWAGATHAKEGLLCMANRGPNTNGQQFFITDAPAAQLDRYKSYTIFGECSPMDIVHKIAAVPKLTSGEGSTPISKPEIKMIRVTRVKTPIGPAAK